MSRGLVNETGAHSRARRLDRACFPSVLLFASPIVKRRRRRRRRGKGNGEEEPAHSIGRDRRAFTAPAGPGDNKGAPEVVTACPNSTPTVRNSRRSSPAPDRCPMTFRERRPFFSQSSTNSLPALKRAEKHSSATF